MITDLFSHKIHSSGEDWPDKLVELATLFSEFDGDIYDRNKIEKKLLDISPRAAYAPRDRLKFRDEISAYPAYLGLYHLLPSEKGWKILLSETAKTLLLAEQPDVGAFLRLQLTLFQYPNGMGAVYRPFTNKLRIQANAQKRTLEFIKNEIHLSPLRLIIASLLTLAELRSTSPFDASISFSEIFALANDLRINKSALPDKPSLVQALGDFQKGRIKAPEHFESRFHILGYTELFDITESKISIRQPVNERDKDDLIQKVNEIIKVDYQFNGFDSAQNGEELAKLISEGSWANYFDGQKSLRGDTVKIVTADILDMPTKEISKKAPVPAGLDTYPLTERKEYRTSAVVKTRQKELANPELTKIKRERQNLAHKILLDKMATYIKKLGARPLENPHVDLYAEIPKDGAFLFEVKSGGENILAQLRKGLSQLYEYKFRYKSHLMKDVVLCLVVPKDPIELPWIHEYLCVDRGICICWFSDNNQIVFPVACKNKMEVLVAA